MLPKRTPVHFKTELLDPEAVKVIHRLKNFGYEAYLVGGCVRDLLLNVIPKDFDLATSATPQEVRRVFRNCRIIGRRFRLAHVFFANGKIIEVATFRDTAPAGEPEVPPEEAPVALEAEAEEIPETSEKAADLLIRDDNVFGNAETDALRRDFSLNALFYDVTTGEVIDYVGGLDDLKSGWLVSIGDPEKRLREDPVRIIRAAKFSARLNLKIEENLAVAMKNCAEEIAKASPARVIDEIFKILAGKGLGQCLRSLHTLGILSLILPPFMKALDQKRVDGDPEEFWRIFDALESGLLGATPSFLQEPTSPYEASPSPPRELQSANRSILFAVLAFPILKDDFWNALNRHGREAYAAGQKLRRRIQDFATVIRNPRKITWHVQQMYLAQERLFRGAMQMEAQNRGSRKKRRFSPADFVARGHVKEAHELMWLIGTATERFPCWEQYHSWETWLRERQKHPAQMHGPGATDLPRSGRRRRRRRRRRRPGGPQVSGPVE